jgi:glycosyltransferase involved in cell wall biosynthesis
VLRCAIHTPAPAAHLDTAAICAATSIVIPAFNEGPSVGRVVADLRSASTWQEIVVVDDGSTDDTAAAAEAAGARVVRHPYNKGNGASVKTGIRHAIGRYILIVDADGQHQPADAVRLAARLDVYDLVVGARTGPSQAGWRRRAGNELLNVLAGYMSGHPIPDLTSGFRAAPRQRLLEFLHLLPNGFSTPTTTTMAFLRAGYSVRFEPVEAARREGSSKIRLASDGAKFLLILLKVMTIYSPLRIFVPVSGAAFMIGAGYAAWTIATQEHVTNSSVLLIVLSVMILLIGLVSEQIASLRFEGRGE